MMRIEYSPGERLLYVRLGSGDVAETFEVEDGVVADLGDDGQPVGVEFLAADDFFGFLARRAQTTDGVVAIDVPAGLAALIMGAPQEPRVAPLEDVPAATVGPPMAFNSTEDTASGVATAAPHTPSTGAVRVDTGGRIGPDRAAILNRLLDGYYAVGNDQREDFDALAGDNTNQLLHPGLGQPPLFATDADLQALAADGWVNVSVVTPDLSQVVSLTNKAHLSYREARDLHVAAPTGRVTDAARGPTRPAGATRRTRGA